MIGDLLNTNKRREVKTREDQVMFNGKKYRRDKKTRLLCMHDWSKKATSRGYVGSRSGTRGSRWVRNPPRKLG